LHHIDQTSRTRVAQTHPALDQRGRGFAFTDDQGDHFFQHRISFRQHFAPGHAAFPGGDSYWFQYSGFDLRLIPIFPIVDRRVYFLVRDKAALYTTRSRGIRSQEQHIAAPHQ